MSESKFSSTKNGQGPRTKEGKKEGKKESNGQKWVQKGEKLLYCP